MARIALVLILFLLVAPGAAAVVRTGLSPAEIQEAMAYGKARFEELKGTGPIDDLEPGYVVDLGTRVGRAMLFTEFASIALETRRFLAIGRDLRPEGVSQVLGPLRGKLRFAVTLVGTQRDFLRTLTVRLVQGETVHRPVSWEVFRSSPVGEAGRWTAPAQYFFATKDLDLAGPAILLMTDDSGKELRFGFDLGRLR